MYVFPFFQQESGLKVFSAGPGSIIEVRKILPLLLQSSPQFPSFHVVTFSLPGFGFSEGPRKPGFAAEQYAEVMKTLYT
jgi:pimeloyl-ACP methyl ester carboxylesterase